MKIILISCFFLLTGSSPVRDYNDVTEPVKTEDALRQAQAEKEKYKALIIEIQSELDSEFKK